MHYEDEEVNVYEYIMRRRRTSMCTGTL